MNSSSSMEPKFDHNWTEPICEDIVGWMRVRGKDETLVHADKSGKVRLEIRDEFIKRVLFIKRLQAYEQTREYLVKYD